MKTKCGVCKFYDGSDCTLGMLQKFRDKGIEISNDADGNPVVHRSCIRCRLPNWSGNIEEEIQQKVDVILQNPTLEMIESINESTVPPCSVVIIVTGPEVVADLFTRYKEYRELSKVLDVPTKITVVPRYDDREIIKAAAKQCTGTFFVRLKDGRTLDKSLIEDFNNLVVNEFAQIILLRDKKTGENYGMNYGFSVAIQFGPLEEAETVVAERYWWTR